MPDTTGMRKNWRYRRGDIYLANLNPFKGSEQGGIRPVVVIQNNAGNFFSETLNILPITSEIKKRNQPTHYVLRYTKKLPTRGLPKISMIEAEQPKTISKARVIRYIGKIDPRDMTHIDDCLRASFGLDEETPLPECEEFP